MVHVLELNSNRLDMIVHHFWSLGQLVNIMYILRYGLLVLVTPIQISMLCVMGMKINIMCHMFASSIEA